VTMGKYVKRFLIALSVLLNVALGGPSNQTFSARNWQWKREKRKNLVFYIDKVLGVDHCSNSWSYWITRKEKKDDK
jgi:hypothetical protein